MRRLSWSYWLAFCLLVVAPGRLRAADAPGEVAASVRAFFAGAEQRLPGSAGNAALEEKIARRFAASGLDHGEMHFVCPVFRPGGGTLRLPSGVSLPLQVLHPTVFRPGNFAETDFEAPLLYAGHATEADLAATEGMDFHGVMVVLEFDCGSRWRRFLRFGVKGFLFLGAESYSRADAEGKIYGTEVGVPRLFVAPESAASLRRALLRGKAHSRIAGRFHVEPSLWENRMLRDLWVLIPGSDAELSREVVLITAPLDANGVVPAQAESAQDGLNLYLLMQLFEQFRRQPPARTVLLAAVNAHTRNYLGERTLAWGLLTPRERLESVQDILAKDLRVQRLLVSYYERFNLQPPTAEDAELITRLRGLMDTSTGRNVTIKEPIVDLARREVNHIKARKLNLVRENLDPEERDRRRRELERQQQRFVSVLTLFNKVGVRTDLLTLAHDAEDASLSAAERDDARAAIRVLKSFVDEIIHTRKRWADLNEAEMERITANSRLRGLLGTRHVVFALCLEFSWASPNIGFSAGNPAGLARWPHKWGINVARIAGALRPPPPESGAVYVDALTKRGGLPEGHFFPAESRTVGVFQAAGPTPAFAARTVYCDHGRAFAPDDTFEKVDYGHVAAVLDYFPVLLRAMLADQDLTAPSELQRPTGKANTWGTTWGVQVKAFKFDEFSASVLPRLPVPGSALILHDPADAYRVPLRSGDVVTGYVALTDERASAVFYGVNSKALFTNAFHYDDRFLRVDHAIDAGEAELKMSSTIYHGMPSKVLALFPCVEYPLWVRENPAAISVQPITEYVFKILNGRLNSAPKRYGMIGISSTFSTKGMLRMAGPAAIYMEAGEPLKLLTTDKVLALNADKKDPKGSGFEGSSEWGADYFAVAVRDMSMLNHYRQKKLRGTTDELADSFLKRGDEAIARMRTAAVENRHLAYLRALYEALGAHGKAYGRMTAITNDMLKAVVFYLALMLPFCFFVEKLLFKFKRIENEMLAFGALFVVTFLVFRGIHPAFRIAQAPEAIFIAFVMGGLGAFVIYILHGRFEGEMQLLFKTYPGMESGTAGTSIVGQEAMLIGVNNMKRRRIRTALTTATVVLVTFTMLAFTSISKRMSPTIITRSKRAPYTGLMVHWPGNSRMDEATMTAFRELFHGRADVLVRRWLLPPKTQDASVPFRVEASTGAGAGVDGVLGLDPAEDGFLARLPLAAGEFFRTADENRVLLPGALARSLGIDPDDIKHETIRFRGREYGIAGILRDEEFRLIHDLNQRPILPIKSLLVQPGQGQNLEAVTSQDKEEGESGVFYVDMAALLIMPLGTAERLGAQPYSVSVRLHTGVSLWPVVDDLLTITNASKFFIASTAPFKVGVRAERETAAGVYYIGEGYRTSIGGLAFLIIPLLISSTIILNTMLGSVFERKSEIAIYNAVGLNPTHITIFFLAEAFVYSVIGSVGGYLVGQATSLVLTRTGIISDINLNFSSLSVVYVIVFTVLVVLLSTLYPSLVASKAAVPSGKRKWSLPEHDGNRMQVIFPFIYDADLVIGLMGYLAEYFARFTEASFGDVIAELERVETGTDEADRPTYGLRYNVALAPFDLGVTQRTVFQARYDDRVQAFRIIMDVTRLSGQDTNWATTNKPFLEHLRTYLLHWRNLDSSEHADFKRKGKDVLGTDRARQP